MSGIRERQPGRAVNGQDQTEMLMDYLRESSERQRDVAEAIDRFSHVAEAFVQVVTPAAGVIADSGRRLDALCKFAQKWGLIFLWSFPIVAMLVGAITPNAAVRIDQFLKLMGH